MTESVRPVSLRDYQEMFNSIFGEHNDRHYETSYILLRVVEEMSKLGEAIRAENREGIVNNIPEVFGWFMAFCNRLNIDIEEALWLKYPNVCSYCFRDEKCLCVTEPWKYSPQQINLNIYRRDRTEMPATLRGWQKMFDRIYGNINKIQSRVQVWFNFMEEIGEVSRELRLYDQEKKLWVDCSAMTGEVEAPELESRKRLEEESAEALAWFFAFCTKVGVNLEEVVWQYYPGECNACHKEKCECDYS